MTPAAMKSENFFSTKVTKSSTLMSLERASFLYLTRLKNLRMFKVDNRQTNTQTDNMSRYIDAEGGGEIKIWNGIIKYRLIVHLS